MFEERTPKVNDMRIDSPRLKDCPDSPDHRFRPAANNSPAQGRKLERRKSNVVYLLLL